jgi:hypothetical protein
MRRLTLIGTSLAALVLARSPRAAAQTADPNETHAAAFVFALSWGLPALMAGGMVFQDVLLGRHDDKTLALAVPVVGPFVTMAATNQSDSTKAMLAIDAVVQAGSAGLLLYNTSRSGSALAHRRPPARALVPYLADRAGGLSLAGAF